MRFLHTFLFAFVFCLFSGAPVMAEQNRTELYGQLIQIGKQAEAANKPEIALNAFSKATRLSPRNPRAHLLLAESFSKAGQPRRAEAYLQSVLKRPEQRANASIYLAAIARLEKQRPFLLSGSFVLKPSSNVNNVSSESHFDTMLGRFNINNGGDEKFGIGAEVGGKILFRRPLGEGLSMEVNGAVYRGLYEQDALRYWRARLGADLKRIGPKQDWRFGIFATRKTHSDVPNSSSDLFSYGLRGSLNRRLNPRRQLSLNALIEQRGYLNAETLSGPYFNLGATIKSAHSRGRSSFYGVSLERRKTKIDYHRYWGIGLRAGFEGNVTENLRMGLNAGIAMRSYDADFASVNFARQDKILKLGLSATNRKIKVFGATPRVNCSIERQKSNIALYSKTTTECQLGWYYRF